MTSQFLEGCDRFTHRHTCVFNSTPQTHHFLRGSCTSTSLLPAGTLPTCLKEPGSSVQLGTLGDAATAPLGRKEGDDSASHRWTSLSATTAKDQVKIVSGADETVSVSPTSLITTCRYTPGTKNLTSDDTKLGLFGRKDHDCAWKEA